MDDWHLKLMDGIAAASVMDGCKWDGFFHIWIGKLVTEGMAN